jgi:2-isopropylmalate synthase
MPTVNVEFLDTTLRDGAQSLPEANQFPDGSKPEIARAIANLGISTIEAGFPATPADTEEVRSVAQTVGQERFKVIGWNNDRDPEEITRPVVVAGLSRANREDIDATWGAIENALKPRVHTFISTDPEHMAAKFPDMSPDEVLAMGIKAVEYARSVSEGSGAQVEFSAEAASTTDLLFLERVVKGAIQAGADVVNLPDTVGQRDPFFMLDFYSRAIGWVMSESPDVTISAHNHNDLANAVPNSLALIMAATNYAAANDVDVNTQIESTICGLGERAGNADVFPVVASLFKLNPRLNGVELQFEFNPGRSVNTANYIMGQAGLIVDRQSPVVGSDILTHRSGIHSDGVIKGGHQIYTPFDPQFWGHNKSARHEDGLYQGRSGREAAMTRKA